MGMDAKKLRVELARSGMAQWRLARWLGLRPSTFSDWVRGARPSPCDLQQRVERALELETGALDADVGATIGSIS